jgi:TolA-binding protein
MRFLPILVCACFLALAHQHTFAQDSKENADLKLALNLYNDGLYDLAIEQLRQFMNTYPSAAQAVDARFYLGSSQLKLKQYDDARLTFQTFAVTYQENPRAPEAWWNVGEAYAALNNQKEAALAFERVKVFHPKNKLAPDALVRASGYFARAGDRDNARRVLRVVLQEYPTSGAALTARMQLAHFYFDDGNLEQAQAELKKVIEDNPTADGRAQATLELANIYRDMGRTQQAQSMYQEIITKYKSAPAVQGAYLNLGKLLLLTGGYLEAVDDFKKALTGKGDSTDVSDALVGMGDAYAGLNDGANAIAYYEKWLAANPNDTQNADVLWKIAVAGSRTGNFKKSNDACNRILASNAPDILKRRAQIKLALNAQEQKNAALAIQFYTAFIDQHPHDKASGEIAFRTAELYEKEIHDLHKAESFYELLATRYPRSRYADDACVGAAHCYELLHQFDAATTLYSELVDKFPASDLRLAAEERMKMIETFEVKEKGAGLEKLALLIGDILGDNNKALLAYRLGEIYFNDLKNYSAAAAQFTNAINGGADNPHFADALFLRAKAYEYLTWKDSTYRSKAMESYQTFLKAYATEPRSEEAARALFQLTATTLPAARSAYTAAQARYPNIRGTEDMKLRLGVLLEEADSLPEAVATYSSIVREFPNSRAEEEARVRSIQILIKLGLTDSAMAEGSKYLTNHPSSTHTAAVVVQLAGLSMRLNNPQRAAELYKRLVDEFSYTSYADGAEDLLAEALSEAGAPAEAVAIYKELLDRQATSPLADGNQDPLLVLALAKAYKTAGNNADAKKLLFQLVTRQSGDLAAQACTQLGMIYQREGASDIATSYFKQAGIVSPNFSATREIAGLLFDGGEYDDAIKQYMQLSRAATNESDRQLFDAKIIVARMRNDDLVNADKEISIFTKKYPKAEEDIARFELERGSYFFRRKDFVTARKAFEHVTDKYDETAAAPEAMYWIGKILEATNKTQEAQKQFETLMKEYPVAPVLQRAYLSLGNIAYNAEKWDEAVRYYKRIVDDPKTDPSLLPFAMNNLIETYEMANAFDAALALTRRYLDLYPKSEDALDKKIKIGILYQNLGFNDQSVQHLQSLLDEAGSDLEGEIRYYIAEANYNKGDYQQAILDFLKVPYLVTKKGKLDWTANSLYMAGQSYEKMGRYDQALTMYQQIVDRAGIDETFKAAAKKEIDRVKLVLKKSN